MQVNVEVGGGPEALDQRDGTAVAFVNDEPGSGLQMPGGHALHHHQHQRDQLGLCGRPQAHWVRYRQQLDGRVGTWGMTWSTRCAAICDIGHAPYDRRYPAACS